MTKFFHLHLVSDATGETLRAVAKAAAVQYEDFSPVEHMHSLVRTQKRLDSVLLDIAEEPGVVLYTIVNDKLRQQLETRCHELTVPCLSVLDSVLAMLSSYLHATTKPQIGAQHVLDAEYFKRIEAINFTMMHDDGHHTEDLADADVVLVGISRTSKTPTSIYLAGRGIKTANIPIIRDIPPPNELDGLKGPLIVGLVASPDRILHIRKNRLLSLQENDETSYVDRGEIGKELIFARNLCARHGWPVIDVTRRSIEETAAAVLNLYQEHCEQRDKASAH